MVNAVAAFGGSLGHELETFTEGNLVDWGVYQLKYISGGDRY